MATRKPAARNLRAVPPLKAPETLTEQLVFRMSPTLRRRLEAYQAQHAGEVRGLGNVVRHVLESTDW